MKKITFNIINKRCSIESTANPCFYKMIIETKESLKIRSFYAMNFQSALLYAIIDATGVVNYTI